MDELQRHLHASAALEGRAQNLMALNNLMECVHQSLPVNLPSCTAHWLPYSPDPRCDKRAVVEGESKSGLAGILHILVSSGELEEM
jgi:hypothetical protein